MQSTAAKAIGYIRVSTEEQHLGPDAQRSAIAAWCEREGYDLVAVHVDHGISGGAPLDKRPGLMAAVHDLDAGSILIVAKRDRLARDSLTAAMVERLADRARATVVSADGTGNGDTPEAMLMRRMIDAFAEYERAIIKARTKAALRVKSDRGERVGEIPYGYRLADDGVTLVRDDDEAEIVAAVVELREAGMSYRAIANELKKRGFTTRKGRPLAPTQVRRIVVREAA